MTDELSVFAQAGYDPLVWPVEITLPPGTAKMESVAPGISADQFTLFQLTDDPKAPIADLHAISPTLPGSDEKPDVQVRIELVSFQVAPGTVDEKMPATLRMDMGQDQSSSTDQDPLFWSIAAGLDLATQAMKGGDPKAARG
jgi:hypothetical protein